MSAQMSTLPHSAHADPASGASLLRLQAYPFDRQHLLLQMEVPQARMGWSGALINLIPSVTGNAMFTARTGAGQLADLGLRRGCRWGDDDVGRVSG